MNNVINKFLLAGDKFMPEIHLRQPQFTYSACGPFTRHEERIQKFKETGDTNYVYKNELDKACFVHDAAYSDSKDLTKRTIADKNLKNRAFDIAKDPKYDGYQRGFESMYSTHNEGKSVVAERFIKTLKSKIYELDKLDDIVDEYNNTYHTTIKMKPIDVKDNTYINTSKEINHKDPKFKVGDRVRISKYKNIFAKGYIPNRSEEVFVIKKVKNTIPWTYVINDLNGEVIIGTFYEKELQKNKSRRIQN